MNGAKFSISWDSYLKQVSQEFTVLQQNEEFVDMTLAADGHMVKVHKNLVAVASPYIKAMLQSAACAHPVIFLNNISHEILSYILSYIYMGEVKVPISLIGTFLDACKALCIRGVDSIAAPKTIPAKQPNLQFERKSASLENNFAAQITINAQGNNSNEDRQSDNDDHNTNDEDMPLAPTDTVPNITHDISKNENSAIVDAAFDNNSDVNIINKFIIMKPKEYVPDKVILNTDVMEKPLEILSDITLNSNDWQTGVNNINVLNTNPVENTVMFPSNSNPYLKTIQCSTLTANSIEIPLNTNVWETSLTNSSNIEANTNSVLNSVGINISTSDCQPQPTTSEMVLNPNSSEQNSTLNTEDLETEPCDTFNINAINKKAVQKSLKKIRSHIRIENQTKGLNKITQSKQSLSRMDQVPHYTVSSRGSLQLLLERFLYNLHHQSSGGRKSRWRCIDYRKMHCSGYIDTDNEQVIAVSGEHTHPNHDLQIRNKIQSNVIFTSLTHAKTTIDTFLHDDDADRNATQQK